MSYLIDTNIISEVRKGQRCHPNVAAWFESIRDEEIYLNVLVLGEIRKGVERERPRDPAKAAALEMWLNTLAGSYSERILPIDQAVADEWGRMSAGRPVPVIDTLLAATAKVNGMTLVTRNITHITNLGAEFVNPFEAAGPS